MTPHEFITKWRASTLKGRSASQEHFIDLCRLLDESTPDEADPAGETYRFERGARKNTGGDGWADVGKRHRFAWEYRARAPTSTQRSDSSGSTRWPWRTPPLRDEDAAKVLKKRTLSNLYNAHPQWLADARGALDAAVANTYGWPGTFPMTTSFVSCWPWILVRQLGTDPFSRSRRRHRGTSASI